MKSTSRIALLGAALMCPLALAWAAPRARRSKPKTRVVHRAPVRLARALPTSPKVAPLDQSKLPRYVSLATIKRIQNHYQGEPYPGLQPFWEGHALKTPMSNLLTGPTFDLPAPSKAPVKGKKAPVYLAQGFPRPIAPAAVPSGRGTRNVVPNWVRYPLEFQLAGIGLGTKAVDKDRFNRIDRYGLFALHGNPTAVVLPVVAAGGGNGGGAEGGATGGGAPSAAGGRGGGGLTTGSGSEGGAPGAAGATGGATASTNLTLSQTPPEAAALFPNSQQGGLPDWALAVTVQLNQNQVEWLYKRDTYAMGFVVDRLGYCEAIIVAGIRSPIAKTQLEDPIHTVKLGDDLRKVLFRYGYPDSTVPLGPDPVATADSVTGTPGGGAGGAGGLTAGGAEGAAGGGLTVGRGGSGGGSIASASGGASLGGPSGAGGEGGAAGGGTTSNGAFRTYDVRYDQTYNTVFTIRNNRVVRIYIFGDPDFFNAQRRNALRTRY